MGRRVYTYIDGFNLYHGAIEETPYKWLDLVSLGRCLVVGEQVLRTKYFTAPVLEIGDPNRPGRQRTYWRALEALYGNEIEIIKGYFRIDTKLYPKAIEKNGGYQPSEEEVLVIKKTEKGSDVNLAVHLLNDAFDDLYDIALIISNDSDFLSAIETVRNRFNKEVIIANPSRYKGNRTAKKLKELKIPERKIRKRLYAKCQMPDPIIINGKKIHKPSVW